MSAARTLKTWTRMGRDILFPRPAVVDVAATAAVAEADSVWSRLFAPFGVLTQDAEVLEIGCGDGRLLHALLDRGEVRAAIGVDAVARWDGQDGAPPWPWRDWDKRLTLRAGSGQLDMIEPESLDLILCRDLEAAFSIGDIEEGLSRLYDILRPGGEILVRARCASPRDGAAGYGFMTPTAWTMLAMRAGFELGEIRKTWRDPADQQALAGALAWTSETEALVGEVAMRLIRPWEADDLASLTRRLRKRK